MQLIELNIDFEIKELLQEWYVYCITEGSVLDNWPKII